MYTRMRIVAAGAAVALIAGTAGAAAASTSSAASPSTSASKSPTSSPSSPAGADKGGKPGDQWLAQLAASLHVSVQKLQAALIDAKQTIGRLGVAPTNSAIVSVVAHDLGISRDKATQLIKEVFGEAAPGKGGPGKPGGNYPPPGTPDPRISQTLAGILHISVARAAQVLEQLDRIALPNRGVSPDNPQFRALAASLHLTPQQLINALVQMKEDLVGSMPPPSKSPVPVPSGSKS